MGKKKIWSCTGFVLLAGGLCLLGGCGKSTTYGSVKLISQPPGAEVVNLRDDAILGTTPAVVTWEGKEGDEPESVTVEFRKPGFLEKINSFWVNKRYPSREASTADPQEIIVELKERKGHAN